MSIFSLLCPTRRCAGGPNRRTRFRPRLQVLEGRLAPALLSVNTAADETTPDSGLSLREAINVVNSGISINVM
jgi:CSLREA domain-containing protein